MRRNKENEIGASEKAAEREKLLSGWVPSTETGKAVMNGELTSLDEIFDKNLRIVEPQIVDYLVQELEEKLIDFKKTTKVRRSGRQFSFRASVLIGDGNNYIGLGTAKDREKWPAIRKAANKAKLNLVRVRKGCGSWECTCGAAHSVPFRVEGKYASIRVILLPAPKGTGLVVGSNITNVMKFVGIKDVWSKSYGNTGSKLEFVGAAIDALKKTTTARHNEKREKKTEGM